MNENVLKDHLPSGLNQNVVSGEKELEKVVAEDNLSNPGMKLDMADISEERFLAEMHEFSDVFAVNDSDLGQTSLSEHNIDTGESPPIKLPPRRAPTNPSEI